MKPWSLYIHQSRDQWSGVMLTTRYETIDRHVNFSTSWQAGAPIRGQCRCYKYLCLPTGPPRSNTCLCLKSHLSATFNHASHQKVRTQPHPIVRVRRGFPGRLLSRQAERGAHQPRHLQPPAFRHSRHLASTSYRSIR